jgi:endonuclease V-like protein UPF0215 family
MRRLSNVIGFDDAPFAREHRGDVRVVGVVFAKTRIDGLVIGKVRRDGANATRVLVDLVQRSRFLGHLQGVVLQGIALAGFNVVDVHGLHAALGLPVLVVARRRPDLGAMHAALRGRVPGGMRKWRLIERAGPMEPCAGVFVQRVGLSAIEAEALVRGSRVHGLLPEPVRVAHLVAGAIATGTSRGRA